MRLFLLVNLAIYCATTFTFAYKLASEDTIVIEAGDENDWERSGRASSIEDSATTTIIPDFKSGECTTTQGRPGECILFKECYRNLLPVDDDSVDDTPASTGTYNQNLAEILFNISGICEGDSSVRTFDQNRDFKSVSKVTICCAAGSTDNNPPPLPSQPPKETENEQSQERAGCGLTKIEVNQTLLDAISSNRIVNGRDAQRGEFPWIVALMNSGREFCGGSYVQASINNLYELKQFNKLINNNYVLTAAHCVQHMTQSDVAKLTVQLGDHNIYSTSDGPHEIRKASKVLYNKGFSMKHLHHDVALIKLSSPVTYSTYIQPVCLHSGSPSYDNGQSDVAGWGQLADGGTQPASLKTVNIKVWTLAACKSKYGSQAPAGVGEGMVCAGGSGKDSCRGDSGGPLTVDTKSVARQIGIVSWGIGCGTYPGVYTRVDKYLSWINKNSKD